jgi:hypothetical protein
VSAYVIAVIGLVDDAEGISLVALVPGVGVSGHPERFEEQAETRGGSWHIILIHLAREFVSDLFRRYSLMIRIMKNDATVITVRSKKASIIDAALQPRGARIGDPFFPGSETHMSGIISAILFR